MKKAITAFIMLAAIFTAAVNAQVQIAGGESYQLNALPANIIVSMNVGDNRSFTLEENLAVGLWSARTSNPLQQIVITHQLEDATGGVAVNPGVATIRIIGNVATDSNVDLVLSKPGAPVDVAPAAVLHCRVIAVAPAPIVVAPQQQPIVVAPQQQPIVVAPQQQPIVVDCRRSPRKRNSSSARPAEKSTSIWKTRNATDGNGTPSMTTTSFKSSSITSTAAPPAVSATRTRATRTAPTSRSTDSIHATHA